METPIQDRYEDMEGEIDMNNREIAVHADAEMDSEIIRFAHFSEFGRDDRDKLVSGDIHHAYRNKNDVVVLVDRWSTPWISGVDA